MIEEPRGKVRRQCRKIVLAYSLIDSVNKGFDSEAYLLACDAIENVIEKRFENRPVMVQGPTNYLDEERDLPILHKERCKRSEMIMFRSGQLVDVTRRQIFTVELPDDIHSLLIATTDFQQIDNQVVCRRGSIAVGGALPPNSPP